MTNAQLFLVGGQGVLIGLGLGTGWQYFAAALSTRRKRRELDRQAIDMAIQMAQAMVAKDRAGMRRLAMKFAFSRMSGSGLYLMVFAANLVTMVADPNLPADDPRWALTRERLEAVLESQAREG